MPFSMHSFQKDENLIPSEHQSFSVLSLVSPHERLCTAKLSKPVSCAPVAFCGQVRMEIPIT